MIIIGSHFKTIVLTSFAVAAIGRRLIRTAWLLNGPEFWAACLTIENVHDMVFDDMNSHVANFHLMETLTFPFARKMIARSVFKTLPALQLVRICSECRWSLRPAEKLGFWDRAGLCLNRSIVENLNRAGRT